MWQWCTNFGREQREVHHQQCAVIAEKLLVLLACSWTTRALGVGKNEGKHVSIHKQNCGR